MEIGAVHRLSEGDPATSLICHRIPGHLLAHRKETGRLGGGGSFDAGGGHVASVWGIPHRRLEGGDVRAPGTNIPQPSAPWEALDSGAVDNRMGDGRSPPTGGPVHKDGGTGDGGALC